MIGSQSTHFSTLSELGIDTSPDKSGARPRAFIVSGGVGLVGGAARATLLLCEELARLDLDVALYVPGPVDAATASRLRNGDVTLVLAPVRRGWRWRLPLHSLLLRMRVDAWRQRPRFIQTVGIDIAAYQLLRTPWMPPILLWETTEALPGVKFLYAQINEVIERARAVLVPSQTIGENARATYCYHGPLVHLPFWVEPPIMPNRRSNHRSHDILYIGRLDENKGLDVLIPAFARVREQIPGARLVIRGGGNQAYAEEIGKGVVGLEIGGWIDEDEAQALFARAEVFVLPSRTEGYPLALLEACARGVPIVATAVGSIPELFAGVEAAVLVTPGNETMLAHALIQVLSESSSIYRRRQEAAISFFDRVSAPAAVRTALRAIYLP